MKRYAVTLSLPEPASLRYADLSRSEFQRGARVIGGDHGDIHFQGYIVKKNGQTVLYRPVLVTGHELTPEESQAIAEEILLSAYESIGIEAVEHN